MDLRNNLYTITSGDRENGAFSIFLNTDSVIYAAHFPEMPITPGVCVIQMVKELAEEMLDKKLSMASIKNAKFLKVLQPNGQEICVNITVKTREERTISFQSVISDKENNVYAKISLQATIE